MTKKHISKGKVTKIYLRPCPFCGRTQTEHYSTWIHHNYNNTKYLVECPKCGATSETTPTVFGAASKWNTRSEVIKVGKTPVLNQKEFLKKQGVCCPQCGSNQVEGRGNWDIMEDTVSQSVNCLDCNSTWEEYYKLKGYTNLIT